MAVGASRIYHVNSNCTDLARSADFYEGLGLRRALRTTPSTPQPGAALGLDQVAWDAWMMSSDDGTDGLVLDLLRWTTPPPTGAPPPTAARPGLDRLCLTTPALDAVLGAAVDRGGSVRGGPLVVEPGRPRTAMVLDPDGIAVELVEGEHTSIAHVVVNVTDLERSVAYYRDVMGLRPVDAARAVEPPAALHGLGADGAARTASLADGGSAAQVRLVQWLDPPAAAGARRAANQVGLFRMAWSTDDCRRDEAVVRAAGCAPFAPTSPLSVGDDLPLLRVLFWPGPNGECLELIEVIDDDQTDHGREDW